MYEGDYEMSASGVIKCVFSADGAIGANGVISANGVIGANGVISCDSGA
jgi:hypothetical protein